MKQIENKSILLLYHFIHIILITFLLFKTISFNLQLQYVFNLFKIKLTEKQKVHQLSVKWGF